MTGPFATRLFRILFALARIFHPLFSSEFLLIEADNLPLLCRLSRIGAQGPLSPNSNPGFEWSHFELSS